MTISYASKNNASAPAKCGLVCLLWNVACAYFRRKRHFASDKWDTAFIDFRDSGTVKAVNKAR